MEDSKLNKNYKKSFYIYKIQKYFRKWELEWEEEFYYMVLQVQVKQCWRE